MRTDSLKTLGKVIDPSRVRRNILRMAFAGNSVHLGSSLSLVEIVSTLYQDILRLNPDDRKDPFRDILALSKGHGVMALYGCFRELGWLTDVQLDGYFSPNNKLKGLSSVHVPGVEVSGGSLGHGITVAVGLALAARIVKSPRRVFAIVGDGEINEGSAWEAFMMAAHHRLDNLTVIVDVNGFQAMGQTKTVLSMVDYRSKFEAFSFYAIEVDGHDVVALRQAFSTTKEVAEGKPVVVLARTVKGKGISFMEGNNDWHYLRLDQQSYEQALVEVHK